MKMSAFWFFSSIHSKMAIRNDFMSHGSYVFLVTMLAAFVTAYFTAEATTILVVAWIVGMLSGFIREWWDEREHEGDPKHAQWDPQDILSALVGAFVAVIVVARFLL